MFKSFKLRLEQLSDRVVPSVTEPTSWSDSDTSVTEVIVVSTDPVVDTSLPNDGSELLVSTLEQNPIESEFEQLLLREFQVGLDRFVSNPIAPYLYSSSSSSAGQGDFGGDPDADPFLADKKKPLTETELKELEALVKIKQADLTVPQKAHRDELMERMKVAGIAFDGTNELKILKQIAGRAPRGQGPILKAGIDKAISGLQNIDEKRYEQYKRNRDAGASHDEAWTFQNGGDTAFRRYELEKIAEELKNKK